MFGAVSVAFSGQASDPALGQLTYSLSDKRHYVISSGSSLSSDLAQDQVPRCAISCWISRISCAASRKRAMASCRAGSSPTCWACSASRRA